MKKYLYAALPILLLALTTHARVTGWHLTNRVGGGATGGGSGSTTFLSDSFTEASQTALESHTPETGSSWNTGDAADWNVETGGYASPDVTVEDTNTFVWNTATPPSANYVAGLTGKVYYNGTGREIALLARWSDAGSATYSGYRLVLNGGGAVALQVLNSGTPTTLISDDIDNYETYNYLDTYGLEIVFSGSAYTDITINIYDDTDTLIFTTTNSTDHTVITGAGAVGMSSDDTTGRIYSIEATTN
jgi:hypothetical protein